MVLIDTVALPQWMGEGGDFQLVIPIPFSVRDPLISTPPGPSPGISKIAAMLDINIKSAW
jgi:hypothetical protein